MKKIFVMLSILIITCRLPADSSTQRDQCGDLNHLANFTPLYLDRDNLTTEQKEYYFNVAIKLFKAFVNAGSLFNQRSLSFKNPAVKKFMGDVEDALECQNLEGWVNHAREILVDSEQGKKFQTRLFKLNDEYHTLVTDIFRLKNVRDIRCGSQKHLKKVGEQIACLFGKTRRGRLLPPKQKNILKAKNAALAKALAHLAIDSYLESTTMTSPHVKKFFKDAESAMGCTRLRHWIKHIKRVATSERMTQFIEHARQLLRDYAELGLKAAIMD